MIDIGTAILFGAVIIVLAHVAMVAALIRAVDYAVDRVVNRAPRPIFLDPEIMAAIDEAFVSAQIVEQHPGYEKGSSLAWADYLRSRGG